ncbi:MAG: alanine racemase [Clostridia bacterium]|nr:alanine racemase [Clostridia bacterium]MBR1685190.1 alanine racemase [Clostridia bacterium]
MESRTWLDIDLDALSANYAQVCALTKARVTCVLKSNAYGHGSVAIARYLCTLGCDSFAVSCAAEAYELRTNDIASEILIMGLVSAQEADVLLALPHAERLIFTVSETDDLLLLEQAAMHSSVQVRAHLKVDTGFHRLGFESTPEAAERIAGTVLSCTHLCVTGLYSHLGLVTQARDEAQYKKLLAMRDYLRAFGVRGLEMHLCDSIGLVRYPQWHFDRVRVGAFLYGARPSRTDNMPLTCRETIAFRTRVAQVHTAKAGDVVGYGEIPLTEDTVIATLCAGYGDGYPRALSEGVGEVVLGGKRCKVLGLVCMDQMMVDASACPNVRKGDIATLLGDGITYAEYADWAGSNRNECLARLSQRPTRIYHSRDTQEEA